MSQKLIVEILNPGKYQDYQNQANLVEQSKLSQLAELIHNLANHPPPTTCESIVWQIQSLYRLAMVINLIRN